MKAGETRKREASERARSAENLGGHTSLVEKPRRVSARHLVEQAAKGPPIRRHAVVAAHLGRLDPEHLRSHVLDRADPARAAVVAPVGVESERRALGLRLRAGLTW